MSDKKSIIVAITEAVAWFKNWIPTDRFVFKYETGKMTIEVEHKNEKQICLFEVHDNEEFKQENKNDIVEVVIDGACIPENPGGYACYGISFLDHNYYGISEERSTNQKAEYFALINALNILKDVGLNNDRVKIFTDSQIMVKQIKGEYSCNASHLKILLDEVKGKMLYFPNLEIIWVVREMTKKADELCRKAYDELLKDKI